MQVLKRTNVFKISDSSNNIVTFVSNMRHFTVFTA
jgi:hypothetical protein